MPDTYLFKYGLDILNVPQASSDFLGGSTSVVGEGRGWVGPSGENTLKFEDANQNLRWKASLVPQVSYIRKLLHHDHVIAHNVLHG